MCRGGSASVGRWVAKAGAAPGARGHRHRSDSVVGRTLSSCKRAGSARWGRTFVSIAGSTCQKIREQFICFSPNQTILCWTGMSCTVRYTVQALRTALGKDIPGTIVAVAVVAVHMCPTGRLLCRPPLPCNRDAPPSSLSFTPPALTCWSPPWPPRQPRRRWWWPPSAPRAPPPLGQAPSAAALPAAAAAGVATVGVTPPPAAVVGSAAVAVAVLLAGAAGVVAVAAAAAAAVLHRISV